MVSVVDEEGQGTRGVTADTQGGFLIGWAPMVCADALVTLRLMPGTPLHRLFVAGCPASICPAPPGALRGIMELPFSWGQATLQRQLAWFMATHAWAHWALLYHGCVAHKLAGNLQPPALRCSPCCRAYYKRFILAWDASHAAVVQQPQAACMHRGRQQFRPDEAAPFLNPAPSRIYPSNRPLPSLVRPVSFDCFATLLWLHNRTTRGKCCDGVSGTCL